jgi:hypothetical protein
MQPYKITMFVYADSEEQALELEQALYRFVDNKRKQGVAVSAQKLTQALMRYANNYFVNQFLK